MSQSSVELSTAFTTQPGGLLVVGTIPGCGKTVITTGLALALKEVGLKTLAYKLVRFSQGRQYSEKPSPEKVFMDQLLHQSPGELPLTADKASEVSPALWERLITLCKQAPYPLLLESPWTVATPLSVSGNRLQDVCDLYARVRYPVLVVTPKTPHLVAQLKPALAYLHSKQVAVLGWVAVETAPADPFDWEAQVLCMGYGKESWETSARYLGLLPYSPSISMNRCQQGNLHTLTAESIDLLPIQSAFSSALCPSGAITNVSANSTFQQDGPSSSLLPKGLGF